jgi:quinol monooxygenase YgiN
MIDFTCSLTDAGAAHSEGIIMRFIEKLAFGTSFAQTPQWTPAVVVGLVLAICAPASAQTGSETVYAVTYLDVGASSLGKGVDLLKQYRESSRHEAGNVEFTVLQEVGRPNRFAIVEGWKDQSAFDAHEKAMSTTQFQGALKAIRNSPPNQHVLHAFAASPARAEPSSDAVWTVEHIDFLPMFANIAQPAVRRLAEASAKEDGVVRYDIYQEPAHSNHFSVVAAWTSMKAFDAYETAPPTREFRAATVMPARGNLYDQRLYKIVD